MAEDVIPMSFRIAYAREMLAGIEALNAKGIHDDASRRAEKRLRDFLKQSGEASVA